MSDATLGNLLVVGTSNSIQRYGYRVALDGRFDRIQNIAVGASTNIMHGLKRDEITAHGGFALFDHAVNEARMLRLMGLNANIQRDSIASFLDLCAERALQPIILIMPSSWRVDAEGEVRRFYRDYAVEKAVPFLDGFELTERLQAVSPRLAACGKPAGAHSAPEVAQAIGHALMRALPKVGPSSLEAVETARLDFVSAGGTVERRSGLDVRKFRKLSEGALSLDCPGEVVGVAFNAAETNAVLNVGGYRKALQSSLYRSRPYCLVIWPFLKPLPGGRVTVGVEPGGVAADERNDHWMDGVDLSSPEIELAGLIVRTRGAGCHPRSTGPLDLLETLTDDDLRAAAAVPTVGPTV